MQSEDEDRHPSSLNAALCAPLAWTTNNRRLETKAAVRADKQQTVHSGFTSHAHIEKSASRSGAHVRTHTHTHEGWGAVDITSQLCYHSQKAQIQNQSAMSLQHHKWNLFEFCRVPVKTKGFIYYCEKMQLCFLFTVNKSNKIPFFAIIATSY